MEMQDFVDRDRKDGFPGSSGVPGLSLKGLELFWRELRLASIPATD